MSVAAPRSAGRGRAGADELCAQEKFVELLGWLVNASLFGEELSAVFRPRE
jgi:hypothetical protein